MTREDKIKEYIKLVNKMFNVGKIEIEGNFIFYKQGDEIICKKEILDIYSVQEFVLDNYFYYEWEQEQISNKDLSKLLGVNPDNLQQEINNNLTKLKLGKNITD